MNGLRSDLAARHGQALVFGDDIAPGPDAGPQARLLAVLGRRAEIGKGGADIRRQPEGST